MATPEQAAALHPLVNEAFMQYQEEVAALRAENERLKAHIAILTEEGHREIERLRAELAVRGPYCPLHGEHQPCSQHNWANFGSDNCH